MQKHKSTTTRSASQLDVAPWRCAQLAKIEQLISDLPGKTWVLLSDNDTTGLHVPSAVQLLVKNIDHNREELSGRVTTLSADCASAVICDDVLQRNHNPLQVIKEINHVLRPGGIAVICGAGSLRGKLAAQLPAESACLWDVLQWIHHETRLQLIGCYTHGSTPPSPAWHHLERLDTYLASTSMRRIPSSINIAKHWAVTRPGWVLLLRDKRYQPLLNGRNQPIKTSFQFNPSGAALNRENRC